MREIRDVSFLQDGFAAWTAPGNVPQRVTAEDARAQTLQRRDPHFPMTEDALTMRYVQLRDLKLQAFRHTSTRVEVEGRVKDGEATRGQREGAGWCGRAWG